jgi:hypothetical protein
MFAIAGLTAKELEYGFRSSAAWPVGLLVLILCVPFVFFLSARYETWENLLAALESIPPIRAIIASTHIHHPKPLGHAR